MVLTFNAFALFALMRLPQVGASYLQIKFVVDQGGKHRTVSMELTLPQFYELLAQMEKAKTFVDFLSA